MYSYLIIYIFIFITSFYLYFKFLNIKFSFFHKQKVFSIFFLSIMSAILRTHFPLSSIAIFLLFYLNILLCFNSEPKLCFVTALISFFLSQALLFITSLICGMILYPIFHNASLPPDIISFSIAGILTYFGAHLPFRISKFNYGMKFLYNSLG